MGSQINYKRSVQSDAESIKRFHESLGNHVNRNLSLDQIKEMIRDGSVIATDSTGKIVGHLTSTAKDGKPAWTISGDVDGIEVFYWLVKQLRRDVTTYSPKELPDSIVVPGSCDK